MLTAQGDGQQPKSLPPPPPFPACPHPAADVGAHRPVSALPRRGQAGLLFCSRGMDNNASRLDFAVLKRRPHTCSVTNRDPSARVKPRPQKTPTGPRNGLNSCAGDDRWPRHALPLFLIVRWGRFVYRRTASLIGAERGWFLPGLGPLSAYENRPLALSRDRGAGSGPTLARVALS
jgi:hypothetical protein